MATTKKKTTTRSTKRPTDREVLARGLAAHEAERQASQAGDGTIPPGPAHTDWLVSSVCGGRKVRVDDEPSPHRARERGAIALYPALIEILRGEGGVAAFDAFTSSLAVRQA